MTLQQAVGVLRSKGWTVDAERLLFGRSDSPYLVRVVRGGTLFEVVARSVREGAERLTRVV